MSANQQPTDRQLHRLVDGDLTEAERTALLAVQGEEREAVRSKLEALGEVRLLVRAAAEAELEREALDADAMWAQIAARVEGSRESLTSLDAASETKPSEASPTKPAFQVIQGGRAQERRERSADPQIDERQRRVRTRRYGMMLVGGLAAAAAAAIIYLNPLGTTPTEVAATEPTTVAPPEAIEAQASAELQQTEVLAVDFGANVGTVFSVEGDEGARYAVVWLADESEKDDVPPEADDGTKSPVEL